MLDVELRITDNAAIDGRRKAMIVLQEKRKKHDRNFSNLMQQRKNSLSLLDGDLLSTTKKIVETTHSFRMLGCSII
jgi:hypothetical protein